VILKGGNLNEAETKGIILIPTNDSTFEKYPEIQVKKLLRIFLTGQL
jgi:hypothetical protein